MRKRRAGAGIPVIPMAAILQTSGAWLRASWVQGRAQTLLKEGGRQPELYASTGGETGRAGEL